MLAEALKEPSPKKFTAFFKRLLIPILIIMPVSLLISLFFAEKLVKFASPQITYNEAKKLSPQIFKESDFLPFELKPNTSVITTGNTYEFTYNIRINSQGYRMPEFSLEKPKDEFRILMVGDSMTFGVGVEQDDNLTSQLEKRINEYLKDNKVERKQVKIINAGFADGKSPDSYYLYLKTKGLDLKPDLIIVNNFVFNDISDLDENVWEEIDSLGLPLKISSKVNMVDGTYLRRKNEYQDWRYNFPVIKNSHLWILFATNLETKSPSTVSKIKQLLNLKEEPPTVSRVETFSCLYQGQCSDRMKNLLERYFQIIDGMNNLIVQANIPYVIATTTAGPQIKPIFEGLGEVNCTKYHLEQCEPQKMIKDYLDKKNIANFDTLSYLVDPGYEKFFFPKDGHPTKGGVLRYTDAFYDYFIRDLDILRTIENKSP